MDSEELRLIQGLIRAEHSRKIFEKVFDARTIRALHSLSQKKHFEQVEFVIKTGKEAHVFRAVDKSGNFKAVKIYKTDASDFGKMQEYIEGDRRFKKVKGTKRDIVNVWAKKEFRNLQDYRKAGIRVPMPIAVNENVLVMEFIGKEGMAAKTLKEHKPENMAEFHKVMAENMVKMLYKSRIIHADLSEYNILNNNGEFVIIDVGQGVSVSHPKAKEFFERDARNISNFLAKNGEKTGFEEFLAEIKAKKPQQKNP